MLKKQKTDYLKYLYFLVATTKVTNKMYSRIGSILMYFIEQKVR